MVRVKVRLQVYLLVIFTLFLPSLLLLPSWRQNRHCLFLTVTDIGCAVIRECIFNDIHGILITFCRKNVFLKIHLFFVNITLFSFQFNNTVIIIITLFPFQFHEVIKMLGLKIFQFKQCVSSFVSRVYSPMPSISKIAKVTYFKKGHYLQEYAPFKN